MDAITSHWSRKVNAPPLSNWGGDNIAVHFTAPLCCSPTRVAVVQQRRTCAAIHDVHSNATSRQAQMMKDRGGVALYKQTPTKVADEGLDTLAHGRRYIPHLFLWGGDSLVVHFITPIWYVVTGVGVEDSRG